MRLLVDQGLPRSLADLLAAAGHDALHVGPLGMATADDPTIALYAADHDRVVITLDADFHMWLAHTNRSRPSVIRIRIEGLNAAGAAAVLLPVLQRCQEALEQGAVVSITPQRYRIRRLPLR